MPTPNSGTVTEHATIGRSVTIKGEVSGNEALFIDGTIDGSIRFPKHRVTMGRSSQVTADIHAQDVVVMGSVKGNIYGSERLDIRSESSVQGEIVTKRIRVDDGAVLQGSVEIQASGKTEQPQAKAAAVGEAAKSPAPTQTSAPPVVPSGPESVKRAPGSSVLFKPVGWGDTSCERRAPSRQATFGSRFSLYSGLATRPHKYDSHQCSLLCLSSANQRHGK